MISWKRMGSSVRLRAVMSTLTLDPFLMYSLGAYSMLLITFLIFISPSEMPTFLEISVLSCRTLTNSLSMCT